MTKIFIFLTFSFALLLAANTTSCVVPSGNMVLADPNRPTEEVTSNVSCNTFEGNTYVCFTTRETRILQEKLAVNTNGTCSYKTTRNYFIYVDADCGTDAIANGDGVCICKTPDKIYDTNTRTCSCPAGQSYDGDLCAYNCNPLNSPYQLSSFQFDYECTVDNLQALYNANNTDGRTIESVVFHCDKKCYFIIGDTIANPDNNVSTNDNNGTDPGTTNTNTGSDNNSTVLGHTSYDIVEAIDLHRIEETNRLSNLLSSTNLNHTEHMNKLDTMLTYSGYMHNQLATMIDVMRDVSSNTSGLTSVGGTINNTTDSNITINFDDSGIIEANNNTTKAIEKLTSFFTDGNGTVPTIDLNDTNDSLWSDTLSKFNKTLSDLNISDDLLHKTMKNELENQTSDLQDKSETLITNALDDLMNNLFNPLKPFIDAGQNISSFNDIEIPIKIDSIGFQKSLSIPANKIFNQDNQKLFDMLQVILQLIAVLAGFYYLVQGISDV